MAGPFNENEILKEIYDLVVSSKSRSGDVFPVKYVYLNMEKRGFTWDDFLAGTELLQKYNLISKEEKILDSFFEYFSKDKTNKDNPIRNEQSHPGSVNVVNASGNSVVNVQSGHSSTINSNVSSKSEAQSSGLKNKLIIPLVVTVLGGVIVAIIIKLFVGD